MYSAIDSRSLRASGDQVYSLFHLRSYFSASCCVIAPYFSALSIPRWTFQQHINGTGYLLMCSYREASPKVLIPHFLLCS